MTKMDLVKVEYMRDNRLAIFARDRETSDKVTILLKDFWPYFYIHHGDEPPRGDSVRSVAISDVRGLGGETLTKVTLNDPTMIRKIRDKYVRTWEADVPYTQRSIIDIGITSVFDAKLDRKYRGLYYTTPDQIKPTEESPKTKPHNVYYDLEMAMERFEGPETAGSPIICAGFIDGKARKAYTFAWRKDLKRETTQEEFYSAAIEDFIPWTIEWYDNEPDMLTGVVQFYDFINADNMIGFNSSGTGRENDMGFDHPYFINRASSMSIDVNKISPVGRATPRSIHGRHLLDIQTLWEIQQASMIRDKTLKSIASVATNGRIKLLKDPGKLIDWWHNDIKSLIAYNMNDVDATWGTDLGKFVTDWAEEYWQATHVDDKMDVLSASVVSDVIHLEQAKGMYILPTRPKLDSGKSAYEGATVLTPEVRGVLEHVAVLDCSKMYPNNFISGNISWETYSLDDGIRLPGGHRFLQSPEGLTPQAVKKLFKLREVYDKLIKETNDPTLKAFYKKKRQPIKDTINAFYGVMGYRKFRMFRTQCAETVTAMGRLLLNSVIEVTRKEGYKVVYGDTDSLFVHVGSSERIMPRMQELQEHINAHFDEVAEEMGLKSHHFKVEFEKVFRRLFLGAAKKRYAGKVYIEEGKEIPDYTQIKGFEFVRSDSAEVTADMQEWLFEQVLTGAEREMVEAKIHGICRNIVNNSYPLRYIAPSPTWKQQSYLNTPIWVRAAENANKYLGSDFRVGDRVPYIYTKGIMKGKELIPVDVVGVGENDIPGTILPDFELMADKMIREKYKKIAIHLGWVEGGFDLIGTSQKTLDSWISGRSGNF